MSYPPIQNLEIVKEFKELSDIVYRQVVRWNHFERETVGMQLVRSIDSVAANLVEGGHRESAADSLRFFVIARASSEEERGWIERAIARGIGDTTSLVEVQSRLSNAIPRLQAFINYRRSRRTK